MSRKELTLGDLRDVRGAAGIFKKKKTTTETVTGQTKSICDCTQESPSTSPASAG
ncbi:MAG: hypothetical protein K0V04_29040 [Deltaproteobacteria bacterium]|nr:hypothetical protein [Deltaproteobacteria bacterium]